MGGVILPSPFTATREWERSRGITPGTLWTLIKSSTANGGAWCQLEKGELTLKQFFVDFADECQALATAETAARSCN